MGNRVHNFEQWEELQDEIANERINNKRAVGKVHPSNKLKRRTEARKAHIIRNERKGKGRW